MRTNIRTQTDRRTVTVACAIATLLAAGCGGTTVAANRGRSEGAGGSGNGGSGVLGGGPSSGGSHIGVGGSPIGGGGFVDGGPASGGSGMVPACDPNGSIPCIIGSAEPCSSSSAWGGDEYCVVPPVHGFQIHVGPSDYSNPDEVNRFVLPPGGIPRSDPRAAVLGSDTPDVDFCYNLKTPNDTVVYANHYYVRMRPGALFEMVYNLTTDVPDSTGPDNCSARDSGVLGGASFMAGATRPVEDAALFGGAPEDARIAAEHPPHGQLSVNVHWVNITNAPLLMETWMNVIEIDYPADQVQERVKSIQWYGGVGTSISPGQHVIVEGAADGSCSATQDLRILGLVGHTHASTVRFAMSMTRASDQTSTQVFEDYDWMDPTVFRFDSVTQNTPPDPTAKTPGSPLSGVLMMRTGDRVAWECEIVNNRNVTLTYSDKVYDGEMCNVFGMFSASRADQPWQCFSF